MIERTEREIMEHIKKHRDKPEIMQALAEYSVFMGIPEALVWLDDIKQELEEDAEERQALWYEYQQFLRTRPAREYISFERWIEQYK